LDDTSTRPSELSTIMIFLREGTDADSNFDLWRSSTRSLSKGILLRGFFRGRLDSVLIRR
jgi:hypothetical protein